MASFIGRYPLTVSGKFFNHRRIFFRSTVVTLCPKRSPATPVISRHAGIISRGNSPRKILFSGSLSRLAKSRNKRASSFLSSRAGFRSISSSTFSSTRKASTATPLRVKMTGPVTPKALKTSSPKASSFFLPFTINLTPILRKLRSAILAVIDPAVTSGTNAGLTSTIL